MNRFTKAIYLIILIFFIQSCTNDYDIEPSTDESRATLSKTEENAVDGICNYEFQESSLTNFGWVKTFDENFTNNLDKWNIWTGGAYNYELQFYQANNLQISDGALQIKAVKETVVGATRPNMPELSKFNYTSGRIESKTLFSASNSKPQVRIMARIKLPSGYGLWPAFWSYGDPWPTQGEIDILEAKSQDPFRYHTSYYYGDKAGINLAYDGEASVITNVDLTSCYHVYEVIWGKNSFTYLFDGQIVGTKTGGYISKIFGKKERITLNLAVGGLFFPNLDNSLIQTGTMSVDWVKVFTSR